MKAGKLNRKAILATFFLVSELFLVLLLLFLVIAVFIGIYQTIFVPSQYPLITSIAVVLVLLALIAATGFLITLANRKLNEYLPARVEVSQETGKQIAYLSFGLTSTILLYSAITNYLNLFPKNISSPLMLEILKVVIQTNGFLIGLSGIVFAQMFWAIHNQMGNVQTSILNCKIVTEKQELDNYILKLDTNRFRMIIFMFIVIAFFVLSILASLSGMAQTETNPSLPSYPNIAVPFLLMTFGVVTFMILIVQSKISGRETPHSEKDKQTVLTITK
jgi:hypothetical protein